MADLILGGGGAHLIELGTLSVLIHLILAQVESKMNGNTGTAGANKLILPVYQRDDIDSTLTYIPPTQPVSPPNLLCPHSPLIDHPASHLEIVKMRGFVPAPSLF